MPVPPGIYDPSGSGIYPNGGNAYPEYNIDWLPAPGLPRAPKPRIEYPYEDLSPINPWVPRDVPAREFGDIPTGAKPVQYA